MNDEDSIKEEKTEIREGKNLIKGDTKKKETFPDLLDLVLMIAMKEIEEDKKNLEKIVARNKDREMIIREKDTEKIQEKSQEKEIIRDELNEFNYYFSNLCSFYVIS